MSLGARQRTRSIFLILCIQRIISVSDWPLPREKLEKPTLIYPFADVPQMGKVIEIAPGVVWMRLPLPMALDHINVWGLEDEAG